MITNACRIGLLAAAIALPCSAANMLTNSSFETAGPLGPEVNVEGIRGQGASAAAGWNIFHNTNGKTTTKLMATTLPGESGNMMYVKTTGYANGVSQVMLPFDTGPACVEEQLWVYVVSGKVYIGAGNGGNTGSNKVNTTTGQWELLVANNVVCPANTFIIYCADVNGAEFYVDVASVVAISCDGPPGDLDDDGTVGGSDLGLLLSVWGPCANCEADYTGDGEVDGADLGLLLSEWGNCSAP